MKLTIKKALKLLVPSPFRLTVSSLFNRTRYIGWRFMCPFCGSYLRSMYHGGPDHPVLNDENIVGTGYRQNVLCPVCFSMDRERLVYLYLLHETDIFDRSIKLLHVAPESRLRLVLHNKKNIDYLTTDLYSNGVMVKMDITNIQYPDNSFDVIICNHVLEHIIDDKKAMSELFRVLMPDGLAILQVPLSVSLKDSYEDYSITSASERERAFGRADHVRIYAKEDYKKRLEQTGFTIIEFNWPSQGKNFGGVTNKFALIEKETLYVVKKQQKERTKQQVSFNV